MTAALAALVIVLALLAVFCLLAALAGWLTDALERRRPPMARRVRRQVLPPPDPRVHRAGSVASFREYMQRSRPL